MVRRAVSARVENHVRGDAKFLGGGDARDRPADHGGDGLPLPQYPRIQSKTAGRSLPEGWPVGRIIDDPAADQIRISLSELRIFLNTWQEYQRMRREALINSI